MTGEDTEPIASEETLQPEQAGGLAKTIQA